MAPLLQQLAEALRNALLTQYEEYSQTYDTGWQELQANEAWQKITEAQRQGIIAHHHLTRLPKPDVATDDALAAALERMSLAMWMMTIAALPANFSNARLAAEKLLEPELVQVKLPSRKISSGDDLEAYVKDLRAAVEPHLDAGKNVLL